MGHNPLQKSILFALHQRGELTFNELKAYADIRKDGLKRSLDNMVQQDILGIRPTGEYYRRDLKAELRDALAYKDAWESLTVHPNIEIANVDGVCVVRVYDPDYSTVLSEIFSGDFPGAIKRAIEYAAALEARE